MRSSIGSATKNCTAALLTSMLMLATITGVAHAGGPVIWGEPVNLSNSPTSSKRPTIAADGYGLVHVVWCEDVGGREIAADESGARSNTILYRRWDGQSWSEAVDVAFVEGDPLADHPSLTIDATNQLHLVWTGLAGLYYSTASAFESTSARAWSAPESFAPPGGPSRYESDVAVDAQGQVHVVYVRAGDIAGLYYATKPAENRAWSTPVSIAGGTRSVESALADARLVIDAAGRLHAVWSAFNNKGYGQAVYYARCERAGAPWSEPIRLADANTDTEFTGLPSLIAHGEDELLLIYIDRGYDPDKKGRMERTSSDGGKTWSGPHYILSDMEGVNGFLIPLLDGEGGMHLAINMRTRADQRVGIYYAPRSGQDWSPVEPVALDEPYGPSAHFMDASMRLGNQIHIVWEQLYGAEIWHVRGTISNVEQRTAQGVPTPAPPTATPLAAASSPAIATIEPTAAPVRGAVQEPTAAPDPAVRSRTMWSPVIWAVIPVLLLIACAAIWRMRTHAKR